MNQEKKFASGGRLGNVYRTEAL